MKAGQAAKPKGLALLLTSDRVNMFLAADENIAAGDGGGSVNGFAQGIRAHDFVFGSSLKNERVALFAGEKNLVFESHR